MGTNEMDRATDSGPTASCSTPQEFVDDLMLEECFRSETGEELDSVNEKETEKVEVDEKGNMTDCKRSEESVEGKVEKEVGARPKHAKCDHSLRNPGKTGNRK